MGHRIRGLISILVQSLKQGPTVLNAVPLLLLLSTTGEKQSDLFGFGDADQTTSSEQESTSTDGQSSDLLNDAENEDDDDTDEPPKGLIYARVSGHSQTKEGDDTDDAINDEGSIKGQIEEMQEIAARENIELPYDPITDKAQSGTDFDRDGIKEVFEKAQRPEIAYLLIEKVDRIGRNAPETLYFIYILQSECDVTLLTSNGREQDVGRSMGLLHTTLMSLMAEIQNDLRTTKAKKERIRGFLKKKNWKCRSPKVPLGYNKTEDGWLEVNPSEKQIVREMFQKFAECESYRETRRYIDETYSDDILDGHKVKTLLQYSVYVGNPKLPEEWLIETTYENDLHEPELNLLKEDDASLIDVTPEIFDQVQDIIDRKNRRGSTDDDAMDLLDFLEEFSLFAVIQGSAPATLLHDCGTPLIKDGQATLEGKDVKIHKYCCPECGEAEDPKSYYRRWPKEHELEQIKLIQQILDGESTLFDGTN